MTHPLAAEYHLREHERQVRSLAMSARLIELAKCCKPSRVAAALTRLRDRLRLTEPCCC